MKGWLVAQRTFELWPSTLMWFGKSDSTSFSQGISLLALTMLSVITDRWPIIYIIQHSF